MNTIQKAVLQVLNSDSQITQVVEDRIYSGVALQEQVLPLLMVHVISLTKAGPIQEALVQIDVCDEINSPLAGDLTRYIMLDFDLTSVSVDDEEVKFRVVQARETTGLEGRLISIDIYAYTKWR